MKILSLDQASRTTGWAVFEDNKLLVAGNFTFTDQNIDIRLMKIRERLEELIKEHKPDKVYYEDIQQQNNVANNVQTFKVLAEVMGVIAEYLEEIKMPHEAILASSWKSALKIGGCNRTEQKRNAQAFVKNTFGLDVTQDTADAVCIGASQLNKKTCAW